MLGLNIKFRTLLLALSIVHAELSLAAADTSTSTPDSAPGKIIFVYDMGEGQCSMDAVESLHAISFYAGGPGIRGCAQKKVRYIQLNNVRSATTIELTSRLRGSNLNGCLTTGDFNFSIIFRAINRTTSTGPIALDMLEGKVANDVISPGFRLISKNITDNNKVNRELSCIKITYN